MHRMRSTGLASVVVGALLLPAPTAGESPRSDKADGAGRLAGTWRGVSFTYLVPPGSRVGPPGLSKEGRRQVAQATWTISADKICIRYKQVVVSQMGSQEVVIESRNVVREMTYRLRPAERPVTIDLKPCAFPFTRIEAGTCQGICERDGDTLRICYGVPPGTPRPRGFTAAKLDKDRVAVLFVLKRKPPKGD